ncbi:MAG: carboxypeptidase regulatory-like domain-containing protein, partial [Chloroflexi bacterium]|nr:carboxypeptidase regulatory-like domain-containing protein [Chloroflexota bacterium]
MIDVLVLVEGPQKRSGRTGGDGRYRFGALAGGTYTVRALPSPARNLIGASRTVAVLPGQATVVDFTLAAGATVAGTVRDPAGRVVSDVVVSITGPQTAVALTDAAGQYTITRLAAGSYTIYAVPPASAHLREGRSSTSLLAGATGVVDFALSAAGRIAGRVTDEYGRPVAAEIDLGGYEPPHYPTDAN